MEFEIRRASLVSEESPCPEAFCKMVLVEDRRVMTEELYNKMADADCLRSYWRDCGLNHRVDGEVIVRDLEVEKWFVTIETLSELLQLVGTHGQIIITTDVGDRTRSVEIIIYDDYME